MDARERHIHEFWHSEGYREPTPPQWVLQAYNDALLQKLRDDPLLMSEWPNYPTVLLPCERPSADPSDVRMCLGTFNLGTNQDWRDESRLDYACPNLEECSDPPGPEECSDFSYESFQGPETENSDYDPVSQAQSRTAHPHSFQTEKQSRSYDKLPRFSPPMSTSSSRSISPFPLYSTEELDALHAVGAWATPEEELELSRKLANILV